MDKVYITPQASLMAACHFAMEMNHFLPWVSSIQLYLGECSQLPSRGFKAKLMVTTSDHVLEHKADFGDDCAIEGDVLAAKRSPEDDDTSGGDQERYVRNIGIDRERCRIYTRDVKTPRSSPQAKTTKK